MSARGIASRGEATFLASGIFHKRLRNSLTQLSTPVAENEKQLVVLADATKEIKPTE